MAYSITTNTDQVVGIPDDLPVSEGIKELIKRIPDDEEVQYIQYKNERIQFPKGSNKSALIALNEDQELVKSKLDQYRFNDLKEKLRFEGDQLDKKIGNLQSAITGLEVANPGKHANYLGNIAGAALIDVTSGDLSASNMYNAIVNGEMPDIENAPLYQQVLYDIGNAFPEIAAGITGGPVLMAGLAASRASDVALKNNPDNPLQAYAESAKTAAFTYAGGRIANTASSAVSRKMAGQRVSTMMQNMGSTSKEGVRRFVEATAASIATSPVELAMDWDTIMEAKDKSKAFWRVALNSIVFGLADMGAVSKTKQFENFTTPREAPISFDDVSRKLYQKSMAQGDKVPKGEQASPLKVDVADLDLDILAEGMSDAVQWAHTVYNDPELSQVVADTLLRVSKMPPEEVAILRERQQQGPTVIKEGPYQPGEALYDMFEYFPSSAAEWLGKTESPQVKVGDKGKVEKVEPKQDATKTPDPEPQTVADKTKQRVKEAAQKDAEEQSGSKIGIVANSLLIDGSLGKLLDKANIKFRNLTRRGGELGQAVWDQFSRSLDETKKEMFTAKGHFREVKRELRLAGLGRRIDLWDDSDPITQAIDDVLKPERYMPKTDAEVAEATAMGDFVEYASIRAQNALRAVTNDKVTNRVLKMRDHINGVQRALLDTDLIKQEFGDGMDVKAVMSKTGISKDEAMRQVVESSLGVYLRRTYKKHRIKNWDEKIPDDVRQAARDAVEAAYGDEYRKLAAIDGSDPEQRITGTLNALLKDGNQLKGWAKGVDEVAVDKTSLRKRMEFLDKNPAVRKAMGEDTDPFTRYFETIRSLSNMVHKQKFLEGLAKDFLDNETELFSYHYGDAFKKIDNPRLGPLHEKYARPEFIKAIEEAGDSMSPYGDILIDGWKRMTGATKLSLTVLSPTGIIRNFMTMPSWAIAQGHWGLLRKESFDLTRAHLGLDASWLPELLQLKDRDAQIAKLNQWIERGVLDSSVHVGDILEYVKMSGGNPATFNDILRNKAEGKPVGEQIARGLKKAGVVGVKGMTKLYEAADLIWKINAAEIELSRIREAYKGDPNWTEKALLDEAARKIRLTWPTRSEVLPVMNKLRRNILVAPFATWASEVYRTNLNTAKLIHQELGDPRTRPIAYKRIAGMSALYAALPATIAAINQLSTDEEEQQAYRFFSPDWDKTAGWLHVGKSTLEKGAKAWNLRNLFFPEQIMEAVRSVYLNREDPTAAFNRAFTRTIEPFIQPEIFFQAATEAFVGTTKEGYPVYEKNDTFQERFAEGFEHIWKTAKPGGLKTIDRLFDTERNQEAEFWAAISGQRMVNSSITTGLAYKGRDYRALLYEIGSEFSSDVRSTKDPKQWAEAWRSAERAQLRAWADMRQAYKHALNAGMSRKQFYDILVNGKPQLGKAKAEQLMMGRYTPFDPIRTLKRANVSPTTAKAIMQQIRMEHKQLQAQKN